MRYTENEGYYTAESTITWPLDPLIHQTPPAFLTALRAGPPFSWGVTSGGPPGGRSITLA